MNECLHNRVCVLCLVTLLLHPCCSAHSHKDHSHHSHIHDGHVHDGVQKSLVAGPSETPPHDPLMTEQHFYIQQLFHRYGQKDRLDFQGFQSLLLSLGLGQVRLLGMEHDDLGHDHVAHLDVLEVQDGHHTHSAPNPHGRPHLQHAPEHERGQPTAWPTPCMTKNAEITEKPFTAQEGLTNEDQSNELEDDNHHHHGDDEVKESQPTLHEPQEKHQEDVLEESPTESRPNKAQPGPQLVPELSDTKTGKPRRPYKNKGHRNKTGGSSPGGQEGQGLSSFTGDELKPEERDPKLEEKDFNQGQDDDHDRRRVHESKHVLGVDHSARDDRKHDHEHSHHRDHKRNHGHSHSSNHDHKHAERHVGKRAAPDGTVYPVWNIHTEGLEHQHEECLNLTQLLYHYGLSPDSLISPTQFSYLCPALLYQIDSRVCIRHYHHVDVHHSALEPTHSGWIWVWGFVSITIISLLSLLGLILVPIINQSCFKFLLTFLVALAVGTLSGDAVLHLLPHSQREHDHSHHGTEEQDEDFLIKFDSVWKGLTALAGIYLLFIIEHCIGMFKHYRDTKGNWCSSKRKMNEANIGRKLSDHQMNRRSDGEWMHLKALTATASDGSACDAKSNDAQAEQGELKPASHDGESSPTNESSKKSKANKHGHSHGHSHGHGHSHQGHCHSDQEMKDAGIASIAWMVIMGDGMHNFSDGLAIGAAFSANVTGGISTSVAVFCHELPHELGDFAVLLKAGMSVRQAIVYNLLSALMAYVGMMIGTAVGQYAHSVTSWIFAITAGMFLYVALVDMLPEMLHGDSEDHKRCELGHFLLQNVGMLSGFGIMLLIAIFEEHIVLDFGF